MKNQAKLHSTPRKFNWENLNNFSLGEMDGENDEKFSMGTFVLTHVSKKAVKNNKYNYVYGNFGSGKSALARGIKDKLGELELESFNIVSINDAFSLHTSFLNEGESIAIRRQELIPIWSFYIAKKLIDNILVNFKDQRYEMKEFNKVISNYEVLNQEFSFDSSILEIIAQMNISLQGTFSTLPFEFSPKFGKTKILKPLRLDIIYRAISDFYVLNNINTLIIMDRIEDFIRHENLENKKLHMECLHEVIEEIRLLKNIRPILFVRADVFNHISPTVGQMKVRDRSIRLEWTICELCEFVHNRLRVQDKYPFAKAMSVKQALFYSRRNKTVKLFIYIAEKILKKDITRQITNLDFIKNDLYKFFPSKIEGVDFFDYIEKEIFPFKDYNPRITIKFFNTLFDVQHNYFSNRGLCDEIINTKEGSFNIFEKECIDEAIKKVKLECLENAMYSLNSEHTINTFMLFHEELLIKQKITKTKLKEFLNDFGFFPLEIQEFISHLESLNYFVMDSNRYVLSPLYRIKLFSV